MSDAFKGRREDKRLITGGGRYTADWNAPGQLYAAFLRADRPHAEIRSINTRPALESPGVVAVLTGEDTAHFKNPGTLVAYPGRNGFKLLQPHRNVLARDRVRYVGEEIAIVVAQTPSGALDAVEKIEIDYNDLPAVADAEAALKPGAPQLYPEIPGNLCFDFDYGDEAKVEEAFKAAAHVTKLQLESQRVSGNPMEPKACLATYDAAKDSYEVWSSSQGITMMKGGFASYGIDPAKVRFVAQDVGGGFGIRGGVYTEFVAVMAAAKKVGKPVKWVGSRGESFASDSHGRAIRLYGELALDKDGKFLAMRYKWICNQGAYLTGAGPLINTITPKLTPVGVYRTPAVYGRHYLAMTNTTPTGPYRGAGRPDNAYLIDRLVEQAARELNIDRVELRRRNLIPKDAYPYMTPTGIPYDSGDYEGLLNEVLERAEWKGFEARREASKKAGKLRGIGLAVFIEPAGAGGPPKDQAMLKFGSSGELEIFSVTGPSGQGHETVFPEMVGKELGIDPSKIVLRASSPDAPPMIGGGTVGSRSMSAHGGATVLAAREVVKKGMELAAKDLEVAAADLEFVEGKFKVKGTDKSIGLVELARKHAPAAGATHPLDSTGDNPVKGTFPSGAHVCEVEVDPGTGVVQILRYTGVDDCGTIINHTLLEGQMHGGIAQGVGQVFGEDMKYDDETGQLLTGSFMDYYMPRAGVLGEVKLFDRPVKSPNNPLGVKGAGEAGTTGSLPTVMNAILDALRPAGVTHLDMPATPARVWEALQNAKQKH